MLKDLIKRISTQIQTRQDTRINNCETDLKVALIHHEQWLKCALKEHCKKCEEDWQTELHHHQQWLECALEGQRKWQETALMNHGEIEKILEYQKTIKEMLEVLRMTYMSTGGGLSDNSLEAQALMMRTEKAVDVSLRKLHEYKERIQRPLIVFAGSYVVFDLGTLSFIEKIAAMNPTNEIFLLSNVTWLTDEETKSKIAVPFHIVPQLFGAHYLFDEIEVYLRDDESQCIENSEELQACVLKLCRQNPAVQINYAKYVVFKAFQYYTSAFRILNPSIVVTCNPFYYHHKIITYAANQLGICTNFMSASSIPGTIFVDPWGEGGESLPGRDYQRFRELPITEHDLENARMVIQYLSDSRANRYIGDNKEREIAQFNPKAPVILYAGSGNVESGLFPYTERSREFTSPVFPTSDSVAVFLGKLASKNGWNLIYKRHPRGDDEKDIVWPENVQIISEGDIHSFIDIATVVVVLISSVSYFALFRGKPVVMLGYTELRGKGCTYEAFDENVVESTIQQAILNGLTEEMKTMFVRHMAQMLKYYLYDDNRPRTVRYGRRVEELNLGLFPKEEM